MNDRKTSANDLDDFFSGRRLLGDDFTDAQIAEWYEDEKEGYAGLVGDYREGYVYVYHALNELHGYRFLGDVPLPRVLGMGSAFGDEFLPIAKHVGSLTIVDPSSKFEGVNGLEIKPTYIQPSPSGRLPFDDSSFDLITCLGVLHHIPNVTLVVSELARCLVSCGRVLLREPTISMGDWRKPRRGLTKRERGIPRDILLNALVCSGLTVEHAADCMFPLVPRLAKAFGHDAYNSRFWTFTDAILSRMFRWNYSYHAISPWRKLRPTATFVVARKS